MIPLSFVPDLLPDELLYSWLARTLALNAMNYWSTINMTRLFGNRHVLPGIDLPTHLIDLDRNLGSSMPCRSLQATLDVATMYPYYRPFLAPEREPAIREIMHSGNGRILKVKLGIVSSGLSALPPLRYCPACVTADIDRYGCTYWHRLHQLPGVCLCPIHLTPLVDYFIRQTSGNRHAFVLPPSFSRPIIETQPHPSVVHFVTLSRALLEANLEAIDTTTRTEAYRSALVSAGFRKGVRTNYADLSSALNAYYETFNDLPFPDKLRRTTRGALSWLHQLLEYPKYSVHPLYHLLLIGYLFGDIERFQHALGRIPHDGLEGKDPPLSSTRYCQKPISEPEIDQWREKHIFLHHKRHGHREHEGKTDIHQEFVDRLAGVPIANTSFMPHHEAVSTLRIATRASLRKMHRGLWTLSAQTHLGAGVCVIGSHCKQTHRWLREHDRLWLQDMCRDLKIVHGTASRVDWVQHDHELCARLDDLLPTLPAIYATQRMAATRLMRQLGKANVMSKKYLSHLPRLQERLKYLAESPTDYQIRKIETCAHAMQARHVPVTLGRLQHCAAIRRWSPNVLTYAQALCDGERPT
ncbi:TnsD family Tn7-like transposition protein [Burkholderia sola]|uniref:TnsD family Tn7-like transposition protein n=1 Tax=Burkholderia sola TaxID=2843302 RepID=UPI0023DD899F|nr:TnsD family Tn7-like transposition protein [Burkholderia sola]MDF3084349.1 TnsD family transposase [Burkholderia sola]